MMRQCTMAMSGIAIVLGVNLPPFDCTVFIMEVHKNIGSSMEKHVLDKDWTISAVRYC